MSTNTDRYASMPRPTLEPARAQGVRTKSAREVINDKPILIFSGLAILWSALFLLN